MTRHRTLVRHACLAALLATAMLLLLGHRPAAAAARLSVSPSGAMADGDTVTVTGSGFTPDLTQIAVGQCVQGFTGPADCNLAGGAQFVNADGSGSFGPVTLKMSESFNGFDCATQTCVIAAQVLPSAGDPALVQANTTSVAVSFAAPEPEPEPEPEPDPEPTAEPTTVAAPDDEVAEADDPDPADDGSLALTGPPGAEVIALYGSGLLLPGIGLLLLTPATVTVAHRRRESGR